MHLNSEIALDLIEGRLGGNQEIFWRQHLAACAVCSREISEWQELEGNLKRSHLKSASDAVLKNVIRLFPDRPHDWQSRVRSVVASIIFDSFVEPALAGARGTTAAARQLIMRAEEFDIHIKVWGEAEHRQMLGQLLPRNGTGFIQTAKFHLLQNGERLETASVDPTGEFHFTDVPDGELSLQIDLPNLTVIGALNVKEIQ
jgi:hypothetical protein